MSSQRFLERVMIVRGNEIWDSSPLQLKSNYTFYLPMSNNDDNYIYLLFQLLQQNTTGFHACPAVAELTVIIVNIPAKKYNNNKHTSLL